MKSDLTDIFVRLVHETAKAWLFDTGGDAPVWIPKSMAEFDEELGILTMPEGAAIEKGLV